MSDHPLTPLEKDACLYAKTGKTDKLDAVLRQAGMSADWKTPDNTSSLLMMAASKNHVETVQYLLSHGADPHWQGPHGCALDVAVSYASRDTTQALLAVTNLSAMKSKREDVERVTRKPLPKAKAALDKPVVRSRNLVKGNHCDIQQQPEAPPFASPKMFCECTSILGFGEAGVIEVRLLDHGQIEVRDQGVDIGDPLSDSPKNIDLAPGCYSLLELAPVQFTSYSWPMHFLLLPSGAEIPRITWGEIIRDGSDSRLMGVLRGGLWEDVLQKMEDDDRLWNSTIEVAGRSTTDDLWAPLGYRFNRRTPGDGILTMASAIMSCWPGHDDSGRKIALLIHWW